MTVEVFEATKKKRYKYVEIFYTINDRVGTFKCFVTDQYAWFNDVAGLTSYACKNLEGHYIMDPGGHCDHDDGKKEIALILGPYASMKLRDKDEPVKYSGGLLYEPYKNENKTSYVYSGLVPKNLHTNIIYSYKITPIIEEHLEVQSLKKGEIV